MFQFALLDQCVSFIVGSRSDVPQFLGCEGPFGEVGGALVIHACAVKSVLGSDRSFVMVQYYQYYLGVHE